jgi:hypothetical protein
MNINLFTPEASRPESGGSSPDVATALPQSAPGMIACPECGGDLTRSQPYAEWQNCPFCDLKVDIRAWPVATQNTNIAAAMPEQATCFFHPEKAFQACCQRCGRFVCALCDLQLGSEHVCPTCFDRGRADTGLNGGKAEWRHRDVLYDSIALSIGWIWIIVWPSITAALPIAIYLHVKYRKAPRSYLIPRSGWRFWFAYAGLAWLPLVIGGVILIPRYLGRH